jgi:hypothetical protein
VKPRFLADCNVGRLARWLRALGYDASYHARIGDAELVREAAAESRVLLDVHWLTDVIAGLALGWAWFSVCAIAFGGRILRFGVAAEQAARVADVAERPISSRR